MAVSEKVLREYLKLPHDSIEVIGGATVNHTVFISNVKEGGTYKFTKSEDGWLLNGAPVLLNDYGITPAASEMDIMVDYLTYPVDIYLNAAISKATSAGIPTFSNNAQYDLFILALASFYYDNRGLTLNDPRNEQGVKNIMNSFVLELRYAKEGEP